MAALTPEQARQALQQRQQTPPPSTGGGMTGTDFQFDLNKNPILNMLLTQGLLSGDVSSADITGLQSLGRLEKPASASQIADVRGVQNQLMTSLADIDEAIELMEENEGKNISGRGVGIKKKLLKKGGPETDRLDALFSDINQRIRSIAGASFTSTEERLYSGGIPSIDIDESTLLRTLKSLKEELAREQDLILNLPGADPKLVGQVGRDGKKSDTDTTRTDENLIGYTRTGQPIFAGDLEEITKTDIDEPQRGMDDKDKPQRQRSGGDKPVVGGALGGITGGLVGSLLGPAGTVGGAAAGTGAGMAMENLIRDLTGRQTQDPLTQVQQAAGETGKTAATAAAFEILLPFLFPKIPTARRDLFATNSPLKVSGEEVAERVINQIPDKLPVGTAGSKTVTNFTDDLINRFAGKNLSLPQSLASRSQAGKSAYTLSGQAGRPVLSQLNRLLGSSLRTGIRQTSPSIGLMDDLISLGLRSRKSAGNFISKFGPVAAGASILSKLLGGGQ